MQRSYSEKSSNASNGPGPNEPVPAAAAARARPSSVSARRAAVRRIDDERRETEDARAIRDAMKRLHIRRVITAGLLTLRALVELLLAGNSCVPSACGRSNGNSAHVVGRPGALRGSDDPTTSSARSSCGRCTPRPSARPERGVLRTTRGRPEREDSAPRAPATTLAGGQPAVGPAILPVRTPRAVRPQFGRLCLSGSLEFSVY